MFCIHDKISLYHTPRLGVYEARTCCAVGLDARLGCMGKVKEKASGFTRRAMKRQAGYHGRYWRLRLSTCKFSFGCLSYVRRENGNHVVNLSEPHQKQEKGKRKRKNARPPDFLDLDVFLPST